MSTRATTGAELTGYALVFGLAAFAWWPHMATALPRSTHLYDAQLIVWILAWGAHALQADPRAFFDANIHWPAALQLTGSEHLLAHQLVFTPLVTVTGDPLLATNLLVWSCYPVGAAAFGMLARRCGAQPLAAWTCGCLFALGPLRLPLNLQALQYPNLLLPLLALGLTNLRDRPTWWGAVVVLGATLLALLTGLYAALLAVVSTILWGAVELARRQPRRGRFILHATWAVVLAGVAAAIVLQPYFVRAAAQPTVTDALVLPVWLRVWGVRWDALLIVAVAAVAWMGLRPAGSARRLLVSGAVLVGAAGVLLLGQPLIANAVAGSSLSFLRGWSRLTVLGGFGTALLATGALQAIYERRGLAAGRAATAFLFVGIVVPRLVALADFETYRPPALTERAAAYRAVADVVAAEGRGPMLELPWSRPGGMRGTTPGRPSLVPDAMLGSTMHWLPLLGGFTGYYPQHHAIVADLARRLPAPLAIEELVEITHLSWILLRPAEDWPGGERARTVIRDASFVERTHEIDGFTLLRVGLEPRDRYWIDSIRTATRTGAPSSILGTPLRPLAEADAVAGVRTLRPLRPLGAGRRAWLPLTIRNTGTATWPVTSPMMVQGALPTRRRVGPLVVQLEETWQPDDGAPAADPWRWAHPLRRDLRPGESIEQRIRLHVPERPGRWRLGVRVVQPDGADFAAPPSVPLRRRYEVTPR